MTKSINKYGTYKVDHTKFGGYIYPLDFNTDYRGKCNTNGSSIANRIARDDELDKQWQKNMKYKKNVKDKNFAVI